MAAVDTQMCLNSGKQTQNLVHKISILFENLNKFVYQIVLSISIVKLFSKAIAFANLGQFYVLSFLTP